MSETRDLSVEIDNMLHGLPSSNFRPSIFRISNQMGNMNHNLHVPRLVSFGPFHHGKPHLQDMQYRKFRYVKLLLREKKESSVHKYIVAIRSLEERARRCYADHVDFSSDEFVKMLLFDGCFIIEFIRKYKSSELRERDDLIFINNQMLHQLVHDLMLVENQIPFFVLHHLFSMMFENSNNELISLIQHLVRREYQWLQALEYGIKEAPRAQNVDHLLGLMYDTWRIASCISGEAYISNKLDIKSATELREAGISFEGDTGRSNILDIKFDEGVMKIPTFSVSDEMELILGNLIQYEHFIDDSFASRYVTDYASFLHCLIKSSKDVQLLCERGILKNMLGEDEKVHDMLKCIGRNNTLKKHRFSYADVFRKVNMHCGQRRSIWQAYLRHNYLGTLKQKYLDNPWAYLTSFGAIILLILTFIQTLYSVLSYHKHA